MEYATPEQVLTMKNLIDGRDYNGHADRLRKILEEHEANGTKMPYDQAVKTISWLRRQAAKQALYAHAAASTANSKFLAALN